MSTDPKLCAVIFRPTSEGNQREEYDNLLNGLAGGNMFHQGFVLGADASKTFDNLIEFNKKLNEEYNSTLTTELSPLDDDVMSIIS